ncbi:MAG: DsbA family protein [Candidatus Buchananbacteria bacterium]
MKNKNFNYLKFILICLGSIVLIFIIIFICSFFYSPNKIASVPSLQNSVKYKINPGVVSLRQQIEEDYYPTQNNNSPVLGNAKAPVTIYEYADFSCQYSAQMQPIIKNLSKKYNDKIKIVFKDLPSSDGAFIAHVAARCAQKQNKFWEYNDLLWKNQKDFSEKNLKAIADKLKLNSNDFNSCLVDKNVEDLVNKDITEADNLGIPGTPHLYINKAEILGVSTEAELEKVIKENL